MASLLSQGLTSIPTTIPTVVPSSSPTVSTPQPSLSPTSDISGVGTQLLLGSPTPKDPPVGPLAGSVPFGFAIGSILSLVYTRLKQKKKTKVSQR